MAQQINELLNQLLIDMRAVKKAVLNREELDERYESIIDKLDGLEDRLDGLEDRFDYLEDQLDRMNDRLDAVAEAFENNMN